MRNKELLIEAIRKEITLKKDYLASNVINTIYFGGGTPSILDIKELESILADIGSQYDVDPSAEITLEANPDDLDISKLQDLKSLGINRLSIGIQSFNDKDLAYLGRTHNAEKAVRSIENSLACGFSNLTIDLIYGIPGSEKENSWTTNLERIRHLDVPHLSCYALTVEPKTILHHHIQKRKSAAVDEEIIRQQFLELLKFAGENGYEHYEISNFAREGQQSRHNTAYWTGTSYIGTGPSAHSYDGFTRQWNTAVNTEYIKSILEERPYFEKETLSAMDRFNEKVMLSLRTNQGLSVNEINTEFSKYNFTVNEKAVQKFTKYGMMERQGEKCVLTSEGKLLADMVISELFMTGLNDI